MKIEMSKEDLQLVVRSLKHQRKRAEKMKADLKELLPHAEDVCKSEIYRLNGLMHRILNKDGHCRLCGLDIDYHGCEA